MGEGVVLNVNRGEYWVAVDHENGEISFYLHVADIAVQPGAAVSANSLLGRPSRFGGTATGVHVHVAFAKYDVANPPDTGAWHPNSASWLKNFPGLTPR